MTSTIHRTALLLHLYFVCSALARLTEVKVAITAAINISRLAVGPHLMHDLQGREGKVVAVYRKKWVIHIERITREKVNSATVNVGIDPSKVMQSCMQRHWVVHMHECVACCTSATAQRCSADDAGHHHKAQVGQRQEGSFRAQAGSCRRGQGQGQIHRAGGASNAGCRLDL